MNYHKDGCQTVAFARSIPVVSLFRGVDEQHKPAHDVAGDEDLSDEDEMTANEKEGRSRWLVTGGKDHRLAIWALMSFEKDNILK